MVVHRITAVRPQAKGHRSLALSVVGVRAWGLVWARRLSCCEPQQQRQRTAELLAVVHTVLKLHSMVPCKSVSTRTRRVPVPAPNRHHYCWCVMWVCVSTRYFGSCVAQEVALGGKLGRGVSHTWLVYSRQYTKSTLHLMVESREDLASAVFTTAVLLLFSNQSFTVRANYQLPTSRDILLTLQTLTRRSSPLSPNGPL